MGTTKPRMAFRTTLGGDPKAREIALIEVPGDVRGRDLHASDDDRGVRREIVRGHPAIASGGGDVVIELDERPRTVTPPKELAAAMKKDAKARAAWDALSFTHQREHAGAAWRRRSRC